MEEISLKITVDDANLILEALGNLSFVKVYALIGKIQEQAGQQLDTNGRQDGVDKVEHPVPTIEE